jgi:hemoglobin-like flavoprotein
MTGLPAMRLPASMRAMTSARLAAIEASLELAAARIGDPTAEVYRRLFVKHPAMEAEFWRDTQGNVRGEMLARSLETILDLAGPRAWGDQLIATEVQNHAHYGVPPAIFADFLPIVAEVIRDACGDGFAADMAAAWDVVLADAAALAVLPAA